MSFLFPLYLLGAAAIAIPILLHLRRRPPKEHQTFSSLMFLEKSPERLTRRTKIERWLLLALRCLALILLALMFGRPFLKSAKLPLAEGAGGRVVVMIDTSASMRRDGLWERALEEAKDALAATEPEDQVALARFDDQLVVERPFNALAALPGSTRADMVDAVFGGAGATLPGWRATRLGEALAEAADLLADANVEREVDDQRIVVISDFQEGADRDALNRYAWPENVRVRPVVIGSDAMSGDNLALHLVAATPDDDSDGADRETSRGIQPPRRRVRVTNSRESDSEAFSLAWQGMPETRIEGFLPVGASRVTPVPPRADESVDGTLEIGGDAHPFDNRVHIARVQPRPVRLLYLGADADTSDVGSPHFYLSRAMHRTPVIDPSVRGQNFEAFVSDPAALEGAQVAVVRLGEKAPDAVVSRLADFADAGNLVIGVVSEGAEAAALKTLTGIDPLELVEAEVKEYAMLSGIDFEHPVLAPFAHAQVRDFTKIRTWRHRELTLPDDSDTDKVRILARFDGGTPAWLEVPRGGSGGRVFLFLSGWEPRESQLALSSKFVPLIYGLLGQAGFSAVAEPTRYVGDPLPLPSGESAVTVALPGGDVVTPEAGAEQFIGTDVPGFYTVRSRDALDQEQTRVHAINLPPDESRIDPVDPVVALGEFGIPVETDVVSARVIGAGEEALSETQRRRIESTEKEQNQKLWKWLLVAVLAILVIETWLAGRRRRGETEAEVQGVSMG